jgi:hypothetical protein
LDEVVEAAAALSLGFLRLARVGFEAAATPEEAATPEAVAVVAVVAELTTGEAIDGVGKRRKKVMVDKSVERIP